MDGYMHEQVDGWMNGEMSGWEMSKWMDKYIGELGG